MVSAGILGLTELAVRRADRLWTLIDAFIPGRVWRPRTYLLVHLALGLVVMTAFVLFLGIAGDVTDRRQLTTFDFAFAEALRAEVTPGWRGFFWLFTWLGSYLPITTAVAIATWRLLSRGRKLLAWMWVGSQAGGLWISEGLKVAFARARPEGADPLLFGNTFSFPSGHAMGTFVLCGVGAYIVLRTIRSWTNRALLVSAAFAWSLAMGFSRLYLGVHYLTDVLAGFLLGAAWVAVCVSGMEVARLGREI